MGRFPMPLVFILLAVCLLPACSASQVRCTLPDNNPSYHFLKGMEALDGHLVDMAEDRFDRSVYCNDRFSPGYSGLAIVMAEKGKGQGDEKLRALNAQRMRDSLMMARKYAEEPADEFYYHLARIRTGILLKDQGWLKAAEESFAGAAKLRVDDRQLLYYQGKEAADYFMALAYLEARDLPKARERFAGVLSSKQDGKWSDKAQLGWKKTDKIVHAMAGLAVGKVGEEIALQDAVSRSDMAALLIDELKLDALLAERAPVTSRSASLQTGFTPADVISHPFRDEILTVMKWNVRGLQPKYDEISRSYLFFPAESVSRGEMAVILEDVLSKVTRDEELATAGRRLERSPFRDIQPASPFYNAVINMTGRGIMEADLDGEFHPKDVVDGAEAMRALRVLKQKLVVH